MKLKHSGEGTEKDLTIAWVYRRYDSARPPPFVGLKYLVHYCGLANLRYILGLDANADHAVWRCSDVNNRDEYLFDFIVGN